MKKFYFLIVLALILGLVLTGCLLSNVGQVPTSGQSGISYLTKGIDPPLDLVGLWHFDENTGTTASDSSGNGNHGTVSGAIWVDGKFGKALSFDGNDYVEVPDSSSLDITGNITVEGWIKLTSFSQPATVAGKWKDIGGIDQRGYLLTVATDGTPRFYVSTDGDNFPKATGPALSLNTWYHLAGTYDGANINLYVGTTPSSIAQTGSIFLNDQPLLIGANDGYGGTIRKFTNGVIDEVRIWSSVLEASQLDDMTAPTINITTPAAGATYLIDEVVNAVWSTSDGTGTGVASETGTAASGSPIDTTTVGLNTFIVDATDYAGNEGSASVTYYVLENFVTGGGKINMSTLGLNGKKVALTFGGTVGVLATEGIVGQFQIVNHAVKGAESWHCNNDFSFLNFEGGPTESPVATHNTAIFEGVFVSNLGGMETLRLRIVDNGEPGTGNDTFSILVPDYLPECLIDGGNFQVHDIDNED